MYRQKNLLTILPIVFVPYFGRMQKTAFQQQSPLPAAAVSYGAVRYSKQQKSDEKMIYVHNSVRSVFVPVLFIEKSVLLKSNENKVKPRYSATLTYRPWKSVNNNSLLYNISIYRHY